MAMQKTLCWFISSKCSQDHSNFLKFKSSIAQLSFNLQKRFAGHSKWSNIKFKKMHIDNARAKVFGKLSMEIIQAVKGKLFHLFFKHNISKTFIIICKLFKYCNLTQLIFVFCNFN